jgi:electron transfer flavoprotein-quinone oxidoreductase
MEESFVLQDLKTFRQAPHFLDNPRLFDHYPQLAGDILRDLFYIGEEPKQKFFATVKGKVGWKEAWSIFKDLRGGLKI